MNDRFQSYIRHVLTAAFAAFILWLKTHYVSQAALIGILGDSLNQAVDPLTVVLAAIIGRKLVEFGTTFPVLAKILGTTEALGRTSMFLLCTMTTLLAVSLSSCGDLPSLPPGTSVTAFYQGKEGPAVGITYSGREKPPATVELIPPLGVSKPKETLPLIGTLPIPDPVLPLIPQLGEPPLPPPPAVPPQIGLPPGPFKATAAK